MLVNLTLHVVNVLNDAGEPIISVAPSGQVARCAVESVKVGEAEGVALFTAKYGEVQGLPEPVEGTIYIVSLMVRQALPARTDLASPGELIRDAAGQPIGCKGLNVNTPTAATEVTVTHDEAVLMWLELHHAWMEWANFGGWPNDEQKAFAGRLQEKLGIAPNQERNPRFNWDYRDYVK